MGRAAKFLESCTPRGDVIDDRVEHQAEVLHRRDIVPVAESGINLAIVHDREAVVGGPRVERQDMNPTDDIG